MRTASYAGGRLALLLGAAFLIGAAAPALDAQDRVLATYPAHPEGKTLTLQQTELGRDVRPKPMDRKALEELGALPAQPVPKAGGPEGPTAIGSSMFWRNAGGQLVPIAVSEDREILYGSVPSRNEFGIEQGYFKSPDGRKVAFYKVDNTHVTDFPLLDITTRTGDLELVKYPMNGMESERVSLGIFDSDTRLTVWVDVTDFGPDRYLCGVTWGPDCKNIFIQVLDRTQKHMRLNQYRVCDGSFVRCILSEDDDKYVEPLDPLYFIGDNYQFVYRTANRDRFRNLYLCDTLGAIRNITPVGADVAWEHFDGTAVYYSSAEVSPVQKHLFRLPVTFGKGRKALSAASTKVGKPVRLTPEPGQHNIMVLPDGKRYLDAFSSFTVPLRYYVGSLDGKTREMVWESPDPLKDYKCGDVVFGTVPSADGKYENHYRLFKPADFDPSKKYPVVVYVYGGPHSQMVTDSWLGGVRLWEMYMAQKGCVVYVQDNRGTQNRGLEYEQATHKLLGQAEMADQMVGVDMLRSLPWVDAGRIGVHGWSYGGFMTISLMTNHPDVFKVGVAGGPVIDWKWYEIMYGERYMETEATNPDGFARTSLLGMAPKLAGKLLICQGAVDKTVVWEHSLSFVQACIENDVQLDYFPYPVAEHNVRGKHRPHLMQKVSQYFFDYL